MRPPLTRRYARANATSLLHAMPHRPEDPMPKTERTQHLEDTIQARPLMLDDTPEARRHDERVWSRLVDARFTGELVRDDG